MSDEIEMPVRKIVYCVIGTLGLITAYKCYDIVPAQNFGVRVTMGQLVNDELQPGFYRKWPLFDTIYTFNNNVKNFEVQIGAVNNSGNSTPSYTRNTLDQNSFFANVRIHYKLNPRVGLVALHLSDISGDNGQQYLTGLMNQSANAVVGSNPVTATLGNPKEFIEAFRENLKWRIGQNNAPIELDSVELLDMNAIVRVPVQSRLMPDGTYESIAGPAAIAVPQNLGGSPDPSRPAPVQGRPVISSGPAGAL